MLSWLSSGLALLIVIPFLLSYKVSGIAIGSARPFSSSSQLLSLFPGLFGQLLRRDFYWVALKNCSPSTTIDFGAFFPSADVSVGNHGSIIMDNIGRQCMFGAGSVVLQPAKKQDCCGRKSC